MNRERITEWIQELKTTDKPQTQGFLQITSKTPTDITVGFCCVGIACEVAIADGAEIDVRDFNGRIVYNESFKSAPQALRDYLGVTWHFFKLGMYLNDSRNYSFKQIADVYEYLMNSYYNQDNYVVDIDYPMVFEEYLKQKENNHA